MSEFIHTDVREAPPLRVFPAVHPVRDGAAGVALEQFREAVGTYVYIGANGGYCSPRHARNGRCSPHCWGTAANIYRIGDTYLDTHETIATYAAIAREVLPDGVDASAGRRRWLRPTTTCTSTSATCLGAARGAGRDVQRQARRRSVVMRCGDCVPLENGPRESVLTNEEEADATRRADGRRRARPRPARAARHRHGGRVRHGRGRRAAGGPRTCSARRAISSAARCVHRTGRSYHLPTGGAVYFDTGVIEIATPMIEIERGCGARGTRALWESLGFLREELDAWEQRHERDVRLVGFSTHYNVSFELPPRARGRTHASSSWRTC